MPLMPDRLDDFVNLTLKNYQKQKWVDISLDLQNYFFAERVHGKKKTPEDGGQMMNFKVQHSTLGTARHSELFGVDVTAVKDLTTEVDIEWSKQTVSWTYDIDEKVFQSNATRIINEVAVREHAAYSDYYELMEEAMWSAPTATTQNPRIPYGIPFWLQSSATAAFGFNGGNPSGFTSGAGGINTSTYANWKNGTFAATDITDEDLLDKWAEACEKCKFKAPHDFAQLDKGPYAFEFYTVYGVYSALQRLLKNSNDNVGMDLGKYRNGMVFKGVPVQWVAALTNSDSAAYDSNNPIYGVNWNTTRYKYQKGRSMLKHPAIVAPGQHTVRNRFIDSWGNFCCENRRKNFHGTVTNVS